MGWRLETYRYYCRNCRNRSRKWCQLSLNLQDIDTKIAKENSTFNAGVAAKLAQILGALVSAMALDIGLSITAFTLSLYPKEFVSGVVFINSIGTWQRLNVAISPNRNKFPQRQRYCWHWFIIVWGWILALLRIK